MLDDAAGDGGGDGDSGGGDSGGGDSGGGGESDDMSIEDEMMGDVQPESSDTTQA
jgi:hypothetical protein